MHSPAFAQDRDYRGRPTRRACRGPIPV